MRPLTFTKTNDESLKCTIEQNNEVIYLILRNKRTMYQYVLLKSYCYSYECSRYIENNFLSITIYEK